MFIRLTLSQKIGMGFCLGVIMVIMNSIIVYHYLDISYHQNLDILSEIILEGENIEHLRPLIEMTNRVKTKLIVTTLITISMMIFTGFFIARGVVGQAGEAEGHLE